jgi:tetratricopeptide (TPR) repeat protein
MSFHLKPVPLLLVLLAGFASAGDFEDGKALKEAGKFEEALPKLEAAVKADATNPDAALALSQVLTGLGRYEDAAKAVDPARKAHPENAALPAAKGRAYFLLIMQEKAKDDEERDQGLIDNYKEDVQKWAKAAMSVDPNNLEALMTMGLYQQEFGDPTQAQINFEKAVSVAPQSFDAAFALAEFWFMSANKDKKNLELWTRAEAGFFTATKLDPKSARAAANLAHCKAWLKAPGKDVGAAYMRAYELSSPPDDKLLRKAYQWTPSEDRADMCQKLVDAAPNDFTLRLFLATAFAEPPWKNFQKAIDTLDAAGKLDPKSPYVPLNQGEIYVKWGKFDEAIGAFQRAIDLYGGEIDDGDYLKMAYTFPLDTKGVTNEQREKIWHALTKGFPKRAGAANNAGLYYRDGAKDAKKSLEWYVRASEIAPDDVCILNDTGLIYHYELKQYDKAMPYYRKAVEIGKSKGMDDNGQKDPDRGYRDAMNNIAKVLQLTKKWADLKEFVLKEMPENHAGRAGWLKAAEDKK